MVSFKHRLKRPRCYFPLALFVVALTLWNGLHLVEGVDRSKFRTCATTQFCAKYRTARGVQQYEVVQDSIQVAPDSVHFDLQDPFESEKTPGLVPLKAVVRFVLDPAVSNHPAVRLHVSEKFDNLNDPKTRWENQDVLTREAEHSRPLTSVSIADSGLPVDENVFLFKPVSTDETLGLVVAMRTKPFGIDVYLNKKRVMGTNSADQFHYEVRRDRALFEAQADVEEQEEATHEDVHAGKTIVDYGEDGLAVYADGTIQQKATSTSTSVPENPPSVNDNDDGWEESFGSHTDKKKFGPSSIGLDISFHGQSRGLFGIPEHASEFQLKNTIEKTSSEEPHILSDPYRLYNLDVFEYELDEPMTLYGSIPVIVAPNADNTVGVFWHNPSETFVDIETVNEEEKRSHWMSESGVLDLFFLIGPTSRDFFSQYTLITGRAQMPPLFAIGYHQCRWNYKNEADVERVNAGFDEHLIPYDVLWLDIEHTNGKRYFTWDEHAFPNPISMQEQISRAGRKMVTIVDPHIKRDDNYYVHQEATTKGMYVKDENGNDFNGWCWPGDSSYVDFTSKNARQWWASLFRYDKYQGSSKDLFTWNDMNEPSVFNGPEVSMRKATLNIEGIEHREWHNMYGFYMQWATMDGQLLRQQPSTAETVAITSEMQRPFVLSRAFFAGSQRFGAIWTGDNMADWGHLKYATKMLLSMSVTGLTFVGADVGGFFGNPDAELLTRWYQSAVFQPFFRGHAHHDSSRREPWVFGEPHTSHLRTAIRTRYSFLPYLYTLFHECSSDGQPVMRPLWMHYPEDVNALSEEDEFMLGKDVLVKPIVEKDVSETSVYLPGKGSIWYNIFANFMRYDGGQVYNAVPSPISYTPIFQRGGSIIPRKNRVRRSSRLMHRDPMTLVIALDSNLEASGRLYMDDEETHAFEVDRQFSELEYKWKEFSLKSSWVAKKFNSESWIERIEVYGLQQAVNGVESKGQALDYQYDVDKDLLVVRKPGMLVTSDWEMMILR